jgi:hypothetical protein
MRACLKRKWQPQLNAALNAARTHGKGTPIVVAKLDRLSRAVHFISGLMSHKLGADVGSRTVVNCRRRALMSVATPRHTAPELSGRAGRASFTKCRAEFKAPPASHSGAR